MASVEETPKAIVRHMQRLEQAGLLGPLSAICRTHFVRIEAVMSSARSRHVVRARGACCLHLRSLGMSYPEIGEIMLRDHTSVMALLHKAQRNGSDGHKNTT